MILFQVAFGWRLDPSSTDLSRKGGVIIAWRLGRPSSTLFTGGRGATLGVAGLLFRHRRSLFSAVYTDLFLFSAAFSAKASLAVREARSFFGAMATRKGID